MTGMKSMTNMRSPTRCSVARTRRLLCIARAVCCVVYRCAERLYDRLAYATRSSLGNVSLVHVSERCVCDVRLDMDEIGERDSTDARARSAAVVVFGGTRVVAQRWRIVLVLLLLALEFGLAMLPELTLQLLALSLERFDALLTVACARIVNRIDCRQYSSTKRSTELHRRSIIDCKFQF